MAEAAAQNPPDRNVARAEQLCRQVLASRLKGEISIDVVNHFVDWIDLRQKFTQHMVAWTFLTRMTIALDPADALSGWLVEKRKEKGGPTPVPVAAAEQLARTLAQIPPGFKFESAQKVDVDPQNCFTRCQFVSEKPAARLEISINPATQELIGTLPVLRPALKALASHDQAISIAEELAWSRIERNVMQRAGHAAAADLREALKLTVAEAMSDPLSNKHVTFKVWTRFSDCDVFLDEGSDQVLGWNIEAFQADAPEQKIDAKQAVALAQAELQAKTEVAGPDVSYTSLQGNHAAVVHWQHQIGDVPVSGDFTTVMLNATTGVIFAVSRKWRPVPASVVAVKSIDSAAALSAAEAQRQKLGIPADAKAKVLGKAVVELAAEPDKPSPVRNLLVWRIGYKAPRTSGYTEVYVDCETAQVVHVTGW
jgi:hypothetical protein